MSISLSTHILNLTTGKPAGDVLVEFWTTGDDAKKLSSHTSDNDGRVPNIGPDATAITPATYELRFHVADYFASEVSIGDSFYDMIPIRFQIKGDQSHYHVPILLSPFGYSTYRGS